MKKNVFIGFPSRTSLLLHVLIPEECIYCPVLVNKGLLKYALKLNKRCKKCKVRGGTKNPPSRTYPTL